MLYHCDHLSLESHPNHIIQLRLHHPSGHNVLDQATLEGLHSAVLCLESIELNGLLISSDHRHFCLGADIRSFAQWFQADDETFDAQLKQTQDLFSRIENLNAPTISLLQGHALGGGCELTLATDFRIASPNTQVGLPEVKLGLLPGWGGCTRLPRLLGGDSALKWLTTGKIASTSEALSLGWVDAVTQSPLLEAGLNWLKDLQLSPTTWQSRRQQKQDPLPLSRTEFTLSLAVAQNQIQQAAGIHYPAPLCILQVYQKTALLPQSLALPIERAHFIQLAKTPEARSLIRVFFNQQYVKSLHTPLPSQNTTHYGVIGAGIMGSGIAYQSAKQGVKTVLLDLQPEALDNAQAHWRAQWQKRHDKQRFPLEQWIDALEHLTLTTHQSALKDCQCVIEAVTESPYVKQKVLQQAEQQLSDDAILMTNTSTIPIQALAQHLTRPAQFCGLHFFNPVDKMPLVEIVRGQQTHPNTLAKAAEYVSQLGKTAITVGDGPGFFVNRVLFPYLMAFSTLVDEGVSIAYIDRVMTKEFGWPMGPAYLLDVIGLDTAYHAQQVMAAHYPDRMTLPPKNTLTNLYEQGDFGQKTGQGFYQYTDKKTKINDLWQNHPNHQPDKSIVIERLMIPMLNEVGRCLEEKIIHSAAEADLALVYGLGFPAFRGGACHYLEQWGMSALLHASQRYQGLGGLYHPPQLFLDKRTHPTPFYKE